MATTPRNSTGISTDANETSVQLRPLYGLPKSLLAQTGKNVALFELLLPKGLNRDMKRKLVDEDDMPGDRSSDDALGDLPKGLSEIERNMLRRWANPFARSVRFWKAIKKPRNGHLRLDAMDYAMAIDLVLLDAFDVNWKSISFVEDDLIPVCPIWPTIREELEKAMVPIKATLDFSVFMLWPRVVDELLRWSDLDAKRRSTVSRTVFALSSISVSDWFVRRSIELCPDLTDEFYLSDPEEATSEAVPPSDWMEVWNALLMRLDELTSELRTEPTQTTIANLTALARELEGVAEYLPKEKQSQRDEYLTKLAGLVEYCRGLAGEQEFSWLDSILIAQVVARWQLEVTELPEALISLADDAAAAIGRADAAATLYRDEVASRCKVQAELSLFEEELASAGSLPARRKIEKEKRDKNMELLTIEERLPNLQDDLLSAVSPFCKPFDYSDDYCARQNEIGGANIAVELTLALEPTPDPSINSAPSAKTAQQPEEDVALQKADTLAVPEQLTPVPHTPTLKAVETFSNIGVESRPEASSALVALPTQTDQTEAAAENVALNHSGGLGNPDVVAAEDCQDDAYSPLAGEACRPIWAFVAEGHLSMAYQLCRAMLADENAPRMPPLQLLESVALSPSLIFPDGGLHDAVADSLANLSEDWFCEDGPRCWHTALNLLLVAATIRPMVLAPDSGAATIAGYLHLDAHYKSLYALVQALRKSSDRLRGFRIDPATIRLTRTETATSIDLANLQREAQDWLKTQAPAMTIKFAPATKVWHAWLRPNGIITNLISPVVQHHVNRLDEVKRLINSLADSNEFIKLVRRTDRADNDRRRGEEIHSGALDHLYRCASDALKLARRWVPFVETHSESSGRMRELLIQIRDDVTQSISAVRTELNGTGNDSWGLVSSAQRAVAQELTALQALFDPESPLPSAESSAKAVLAKDLLRVPRIRICPEWIRETSALETVSLIRDWEANRTSLNNAFDLRLADGDVFGAGLLLESFEDELADSDLKDTLRRQHDSWRAKLHASLQDARRDIEVGSAYGYVSDSERNLWEGHLVSLEAQTDELRRFDKSIKSVADIKAHIQSNHDEKASVVNAAIEELARAGKSSDDIEAVQAALNEGDIATANELLQRVRQGLAAWPEDTIQIDPFQSFLGALPALESWMNQLRSTDAIKIAIKNGSGIPGLSLDKVAGAQRDQAANMFNDWSLLKSRRKGEATKLHSIFSALGFVVPKAPTASPESSTGKEIWTLSVTPLNDRAVCPTPHFGSAAKGSYRVICLWERPTEDDILQMIGESGLHRATIVLYFGRMTERKWRDLSRKTKHAHKSFVLLDEAILLFLAGQTGSRLAAFFATCLPFAYTDPYDATAGLVPPEMFYGRTSELNAILGLNGRCFIYGGRQLGKTALLRRAEQAFHEPAKGRYSSWIDLRAEGIGVSRAASEMWQVVAASMKAAGVLAEAPTLSAISKKGGVDGLLKDIREFLNKDDQRRILLLLDEADRFFEQDGKYDFSETRRLKQLMDVTERRFKVVFAGLHNVLRMTERANHPLAHFGEPIKIGPFIEDHEIKEARDLVRRPLAAAGFEFDAPSLVIRILAQTNYYPSLIQLYCYHLLQHMLAKVSSTQPPSGPRYRITSQDIEAVYSSNNLRSEIRAKFGYTLQLDLRYEVVAYAMALEILTGRQSHSEGLDWRSVWNSCAMNWWPEGFRDTSELDFRVLLDEMVELGVLSRTLSGRYTLRNPNVFLLLGNQDEIETVLIKPRHPTAEFDSAVFRPHLRDKPGSPRRNPLTYQQLSELFRHENTLTAIAGTPAAGVEEIVPSLQDYVEQTGIGSFILIEDCSDHLAFKQALKSALENREKEGLAIIVVPNTLPWCGKWVGAAREMIGRLSSQSRFVSIVFVADPEMLWGALSDDALQKLDIPWLSLLPWREIFVHQCLEDLQLPSSTESLASATGFWPLLLYPIIENCTQARELERRIENVQKEWSSNSDAQEYLRSFGLIVPAPLQVLSTLAEWGEHPVEANVLAEMSECSIETVDQVLAWAGLLGLTRRDGSNFWSIDPVVRRLMLRVQD